MLLYLLLKGHFYELKKFSKSFVIPSLIMCLPHVKLPLIVCVTTFQVCLHRAFQKVLRTVISVAILQQKV